jgi:hypothetical protein
MRVDAEGTVFSLVFLLNPLLFPSPSRAQKSGHAFISEGARCSPAFCGGAIPDPRLGIGRPLTAGPQLPFSPPVQASPQEGGLLPVYDEFGQRIYRFEIEAETDRGLGGLGIGALLGSGIGAGIFSIAFHTLMACGRDSRGDLCSPQEEAMRSRVPLWGAIFGAVALGYVGFRSDRQTWDEALKIIRERRREEQANRLTHLRLPEGR